MLNTGRGLKNFKLVVPLLQKAQFPVDAVALSDGGQLFTKPTQTEDRFSWLSTLTPQQADSSWTQHVYESSGWETTAGLTQIRAAFVRHGFTEEPLFSPAATEEEPSYRLKKSASPEPGYWQVLIEPGQASFRVEYKNDAGELIPYPHDSSHDNFLMPFLTQAKAIIKEALPQVKFKDDKGIYESIVASTTTCQPQVYIQLNPQEVNKGSVTDYYRDTYCPNTTLEVRAGDSANDIALLEPVLSRSTALKSLQQFALQIGNVPALTTRLEKFKESPAYHRAETLLEGLQRLFTSQNT